MRGSLCVSAGARAHTLACDTHACAGGTWRVCQRSIVRRDKGA